MSAPTVDLFEDHHRAIDTIDHAVDAINTAAIAIGVLALASWGVAVATVRLRAATGTTVLAVGLAAVITVCSAMCWCAAGIRHYNRRLAEAICHRIEQDLDLHRRIDRPTPGVDVGDELRAYIAGRIDRDDKP